MVYSHLITIIALCILHPASAVADIFSDNGLDPVLSDEFNQDGTDILNTGSSSGWSLLHPERMTQVDSNLSLVNQLYYIPVADNQYAWFQDQYGSLLYKNVTGNFAVVTQARIVSAANPTQPPTGSFNAGGFVIREATGTHSGNEQWVMFNFGSQGPGGYARELKKTIPSSGTGASRSNLFLTPQFSLEEQLLVCRINDEFRFYTWNEQTQSWLEEHYYNNYPLATQQVNPNGIAFNQISTDNPTGHGIVSTSEVDTGIGAGERTPMRFLMSGMAQTVQVGVMGHVWTPSSHITRAEFDYVRFAANAPFSFEECQSSITLVNPLQATTVEQVPVPGLIVVSLAVLIVGIGMRFGHRQN